MDTQLDPFLLPSPISDDGMKQIALHGSKSDVKAMQSKRDEPNKQQKTRGNTYSHRSLASCNQHSFSDRQLRVHPLGMHRIPKKGDHSQDIDNRDRKTDFIEVHTDNTVTDEYEAVTSMHRKHKEKQSSVNKKKPLQITYELPQRRRQDIPLHANFPRKGNTKTSCHSFVLATPRIRDQKPAPQPDVNIARLGDRQRPYQSTPISTKRQNLGTEPAVYNPRFSDRKEPSSMFNSDASKKGQTSFRQPRVGSSAQHPVELSDHDESCEELPANLFADLSTKISVGEMWLGRCKLVCHGPSTIAVDLAPEASNRNIIIEPTPYVAQKIPLSAITALKIYKRLAGGCAFLSVLVQPGYRFGMWSRHYDFRSHLTDSVWITCFFGESFPLEDLEKSTYDLPEIEEIIDPSEHLLLLQKQLVDRLPCRISRLDSESKSRRKTAMAVEICKYPPAGRDSVTVTNSILESLDPDEYLNDTIIDFKLNLIRRHFEQSRFHVFSSFFYKRFVTSNRSYDSVKRWTDKQDLFSRDFWVIPINEALHWTLAVVCYPNAAAGSDVTPCMLYYDSLGGDGMRARKVIKEYIDAALAKPELRLRRRDTLLRIETTDFPYINVEVPQQTNSFDCGVFLLLFAEHFMRDPPQDVQVPHRPDWFTPSIASHHRNVIRDDILKIAYQQSKGHPKSVESSLKQATETGNLVGDFEDLTSNNVYVHPVS